MELHQTSSQQNNDQQSEKQPSEWEKIFANHIFDKGLLSKLYMEVILIQQQ